MHLLKVPAVLRKAVVSKYRKTSAADSAEVTLVMFYRQNSTCRIKCGFTVCACGDSGCTAGLQVRLHAVCKCRAQPMAKKQSPLTRPRTFTQCCAVPEVLDAEPCAKGTDNALLFD